MSMKYGERWRWKILNVDSPSGGDTVSVELFEILPWNREERRPSEFDCEIGTERLVLARVRLLTHAPAFALKPRHWRFSAVVTPENEGLLLPSMFIRIRENNCVRDYPYSYGLSYPEEDGANKLTRVLEKKKREKIEKSV